MKYFKKAAFLLAMGCIVMASSPSKATHIAGMEMHYECLDANTNFYKISLKAYRWCAGAAPFSDSI